MLTKSVASSVLFCVCKLRATRELALGAKMAVVQGRELSAVFVTLCDNTRFAIALSDFC